MLEVGIIILCYFAVTTTKSSTEVVAPNTSQAAAVEVSVATPELLLADDGDIVEQVLTNFSSPSPTQHIEELCSQPPEEFMNELFSTQTLAKTPDQQTTGIAGEGSATEQMHSEGNMEPASEVAAGESLVAEECVPPEQLPSEVGQSSPERVPEISSMRGANSQEPLFKKRCTRSNSAGMNWSKNLNASNPLD